jgi:hypothetical protein
MFSERDPAFAARESQSARGKNSAYLTVKPIFLKRLKI